MPLRDVAVRSSLRCPVCAGAFVADDDARAPLRCAAGHSFDVGKDGTVHLLPAGHGMTRRVGDDAAMIAARTAFFSRGHYRALSTAIADAVNAALPTQRRALVGDIGCGDGSHTSVIVEAVADRAHVVGVDLAKDAVKAAARRERSATFIVGDATRLPFADGAIDVAVVAFAPRPTDELARVAHHHGALVVAIPEPEHLRTLVVRFGGIGMAKDKATAVVQALAPAFALQAETVVDEPLHLSAADAALALQMTPHGRHTEARDVAAIDTRLHARVLSFARV